MKVNEIINEDVSFADLSKVERFADNLWRKFGIDVKFTHHFIDRVNDPRNKKPISAAELVRLFKKEYAAHARQIAALDDGDQGVLKDKTTDVNVPFAIRDTSDARDLVAKTVLRKKAFTTTNPEYVVSEQETISKLISESLNEPYDWTKTTGNDRVVYKWSVNSAANTSEIGKCTFKLEVPKEDRWGMLFSVGGHIIQTNKGNAFRIFATVIDCFQDWMTAEGANARFFGFASDTREPGRIKLYDRFAKMLPRFGWIPDDDPSLPQVPGEKFYDFKRANVSEDCWSGYKQVGMKKKGGKDVPNCVSIDENEEHLSPEVAQQILNKFKERGADELTRSLKWGDGAACELRELLIGALEDYIENSDSLTEAEYQGRTVTLNKPMQGDVKKFKVYVKDPKSGRVKKVNFGDPNMRIKKSNPARRKSFRARHNCDSPGPKTKARYWSCKKW